MHKLPVPVCLEANYQPLSHECKRRVERMLAERISLEAICRIMEIKQHQLYSYMNQLYEEIAADLACCSAEETHIDLVEVNCETDELWSFVAGKTNSGYGCPWTETVVK